MNLFDDIKSIQILDAVTDSRRVPYGVKPICNGKNTVKFKVHHLVAEKLMNKISNLNLHTVKHDKFTTVYGVVDSENLRILNSHYEKAQTFAKAEKMLDKVELTLNEL